MSLSVDMITSTMDKTKPCILSTSLSHENKCIITLHTAKTLVTLKWDRKVNAVLTLEIILKFRQYMLPYLSRVPSLG